MNVHFQLGHALVLVLDHSLNRHEFDSNYCVHEELTLYFKAHCVTTYTPFIVIEQVYSGRYESAQ